jgi:GNAT superfamily N-acetyltransferase
VDDVLNHKIPHFAREDLASVRASSIEILLVQHWQEIAYYKDIPLDVAWDHYEAVEKLGMFRIYTARLAQELIGYACYQVSHHLHYRSSIHAVQDVLYLTPEHRGLEIGGQLVAYADAMLASEGVQVVTHHSKINFPIDAVLRRQRYELIETVWGKRLDRSL